jgi:hypothetical protein
VLVLVEHRLLCLVTQTFAVHAGAWEYSGGETRLIGGLNPAGTSYAELAVRVESETRIRLGPEVSVTERGRRRGAIPSVFHSAW